MKKELLLGALLALIFFVVNVAYLDELGVMTDTHYHTTTADYYLDYLLRGDFDFDFEEMRFYDQFETREDDFQWRFNLYYSPLTNVISGIFYWIFDIQLGWFGYIESHHLHVVFFASLIIFLAYWFTLKNYGKLEAVIAALSLMLFPRFLSFINHIKDIPLAFFITLGIILFWRYVKFKDKKSMVISALSLGIAVSLKFSSIFIFFVLGLWYLWHHREKVSYKNGDLKLPVPISLVLFFIISFISYFLVQPYLWVRNTVELKRRLWDVMHYWLGNRGNQIYYFGKVSRAFNAPWHYPIVSVLVTVPLIILILGFSGLYDVFKRRNTEDVLVGLWFLVPILKFSLPGVPSYGLIQLFVESWVALAILAGIGGGFIWKKLKKKNYKFIFVIILVIGFLSPLVSIINLHPLQNTYFNEIPIQKQGNFAIDWQSIGIREGIEWVNENAEYGSSVLVPVGGEIAQYYVREDLNLEKGPDNFGQYTYTDKLQTGQYVVYGVQEVFIDSLGEDTVVRYLEDNEKPIHEVKAGDYTVVKIYRIENKILK